jgi:hypothetical protein
MIYKDKRHHPSRVFVVTSTRPIKKGGVKTRRIFGLELVDGSPSPVEASYLQKEFDELYPLMMWAPAA